MSARRWEWLAGCAFGFAVGTQQHFAVGTQQHFGWLIAALLLVDAFCSWMADRETGTK